MKNIFHFGCSFTAYSYEEKNSIVPNYLNRFLLQDNIPHNYYMMAVGGGSISLQYELLRHLLDDKIYNIDLVIFQITHPFRGYTKIKEPNFCKDTEQCVDGVINFNQEIRTSYRWHNVGNVYPKQYWTKTYQKYVNQKIRWENDNNQIWLGYILLIREFCKKNNLPLILYSHIYDHSTKNIMSPNERFIEDFIDFDVSKTLGEKFNHYPVDEAFHFGDAGNKHVAEILLPRVKDKL